MRLKKELSIIIVCLFLIIILFLFLVSVGAFSDLWKKIIGKAVGDCTPDCTGKQCGNDGCGGSCGICQEGGTCMDGTCVCTENCCTPDCSGKECGSDGCGGSCGSCGAGAICQNNICTSPATGGGGSGNNGCIPDCKGKACGSNGCGGVCGTCEIGVSCQNGICGSECIPDCKGKACGGDGCSGSCGVCGSSSVCNQGKCELEKKCEDSDVISGFVKGLNYDLKGSVKFSDEIYQDNCIDGKNLEEMYCEDDKLAQATFTCQDECFDGACINVEYSECRRTDNGDLYKKGSVCLFKEHNNEEVCFSEDYCGSGAGSLSQSECISDSEFVQKWQGCLGGCKDGVCLEIKKSQIEPAGECKMNFECETGLCIEGKCLKRGVVEKVLLWIGELFE